MAPSKHSQDQSISCNAAAYNNPCCQNSSKTPAFVHSWKRRCAELLEQIPVPLSAFHWQPVRSTNTIASMAARSLTRGRWQPSGCGLCAGSSASICAHTVSGRRHPSSCLTMPMMSLLFIWAWTPIPPQISTLPFTYWDSFLIDSLGGSSPFGHRIGPIRSSLGQRD